MLRAVSAPRNALKQGVPAILRARCAINTAEQAISSTLPVP